MSGVPKENEPYDIEVILTNRGKTFAKRVETVGGGEITPKARHPNFVHLNDPAPSDRSSDIIAPNAYLTISFEVNPKVTAEDLISYQTGTKLVFVYGKVSYKDIFDCDHWTTFCFKDDGHGRYLPCVQHESNEADENKCP